MLPHLRFPVESSRGRRYPEPPHPYRNAFQRDRDRVIHARAFRRLEDKTQVFPPGVSDHFRNRLTHTLETAQISRTVAAALGLNEDLTEALALVHDFGHPPFAHAGEEELDRQMQRFGERFNHNLQALRIVETFEQRYARFPGLNLTFELREGIVKHSMDFSPGEYPFLDEYLPGERPPLEAQLIDLADETAYNAADLDDGFQAGFFRMEEIGEAVPLYGELLETVESHYPGAEDRIRFLETLRLVIDRLAGGLIEGTSDAALASAVTDVNGVRAHPGRLARYADEAGEACRELKAFLLARLYNSPELERERQHRREQIARLFARFMDQPGAMPEPHSSLARTKPRHRVVCDYIAGMTDGFFSRCYDRVLS